MSDTNGTGEFAFRTLKRRHPARKQRASRSFRSCLLDVSLVASVVAFAGGSVYLDSRDKRFASSAPVVLPEREAVELANASEAAPDPITTQSVQTPALDISGEPRGAIGDTSAAPTGGAKIIEVPAELRPSSGQIVISDPLDQRQHPRVAHMPDRSLLDGTLPIQANGRRPLDVYAGRWSGRRGNRIAIVLSGLGISQTGTAEAIDKLPGKVTLAFSPDGNSLRRWQEAARRDGHELLLQIPMQGFGQEGAGPFGRRLTLEADAAENAERLRRSMARMTNYVGVMNYTGAAFQANSNALTPVLAEVRDRGLMYLDDGTIGQSLADQVARQSNVPFAAGDILLDTERNDEAISDQLDRLEELARGTGRAVGVATAFPESVEAISRWIKSAESRGFEIVPISALARDPGRLGR